MLRRTAAVAVAAAVAAALVAPVAAHARPGGVRPAHRSALACVNATVPNVVGLTQTDATAKLNAAGYGNVEVSVQKEAAYPTVVVQQFPAAGTVYSTCSTVRIILGDAPYRMPLTRLVRPGLRLR